MPRIIDLLLLLLVSPVLVILFLLTALLVRIKLGAPIFFGQDRGGLRGHTFRIWKFRSMTNERDTNGELLPDELRLTEFGKILRRSRLDELPSFWHVVAGDLALVGPRPLLWKAINSHFLGQKRLLGKPGFTGLSQVSGNTLLSEAEKFAVDCYYLDKRTMILDLKILLKTVRVLLSGEKRDEPLIRQAKLCHMEHFPEIVESS
jgi:lipopolysaccharide/colanic/teichoic acid biosynthesis glycosyltransferase